MDGLAGRGTRAGSCPGAVSSLAELSRRLGRLQEISSIMAAMKNLALVETRKLARFLGQQRAMLANIEAAAADFMQFNPAAEDGRQAQAVLLVIGSERGFCGNFNEQVVAALTAMPPPPSSPQLVIVGQRLASKMEGRADVLAQLDGPTVTEDVPGVLGRIVDALHTTQPDPRRSLHGMAHDSAGTIRLLQLLPLARFDTAAAARFTQAPQLNLAPSAFLSQMLDQYLLAALDGLLYESLAAENRQRLVHMENALTRLDDTLAALALKRNALRQEQIVEEIEVILAGRMAFDGRR